MFRAVIFDVDGVLTRVDSIWRFLHERLGTLGKARENAEKYYNGEITYEEWAKLDVELWRGLRYETLVTIVNDVPIREGASEVIKKLKDLGMVIVAISAGLSLITDRVAKELGIDFVFSNKIVVRNGIVTGEVIVNVKADNKDEIMLSFCKSVSIEPHECIVVGDSVVDVPMFKIAGLSIAFNPTRNEVSNSADIVIFSDSLKPVLPVITSTLKKTSSARFSLVRKVQT